MRVQKGFGYNTGKLEGPSGDRRGFPEAAGSNISLASRQPGKRGDPCRPRMMGYQLDKTQHRPSAEDGSCFRSFILTVVFRYLANGGRT